MRNLCGVFALPALLAAAPVLSAANICPTTVNTNTDCGFILTIGTGGAVTGALVAGANSYDGSDDALVGVINNCVGIFSGAIHLTGSGNGGGIMAFDGDGICTFTNAAYCAGATTGCEGPLNTFAKINAAGTAGDVIITGLAAGSTTFFSLEGSPASIGSITRTPEPVLSCFWVPDCSVFSSFAGAGRNSGDADRRGSNIIVNGSRL